MTASKTNTGNFFEDFRVGQVFQHATPRTMTVGDIALMLSTMAGPDDRAPLSYAVDTREFLRALKSPSVKRLRIAWTPDLNGLIPVDAEIARIAHGATRVFRSLGARVENGSPDFSELNDIVLGKDGNVAAVIIGVGGFLGIGERDVAISYSGLKFARDSNNRDVITVNATKDQLKAAPAWKWDNTAR